MKRILAILLVTALLAVGFVGCKGNTPKEEDIIPGNVIDVADPVEEPIEEPETPAVLTDVTVNIAGMKGPTSIGMVHLMEQAAQGKSKNKYNFAIEGAADLITGKIITGELDIAALPVNVAGVLYNKTQGGVTLLGVNTLGVLYVVTDDETITTVADLKGKTISSAGQGTTPEYTLRHILKENGLDPDTDVTLLFEGEASALQAKVAAGQVSIAVLPEPFVSTVTSKNPDLIVALDLTKEWEKVTDGAPLTTGGILVRTEFLKQHPEVVATFMEEYAASIQLATTDLTQTAEYVVKYEIIPSPEIAMLAIPRSNLTLLTGAELQTAVGTYYQILFASDPTSVGGAIPGNDFFYSE